VSEVYLNREWVDKREARIPLNEAGFLRGDGVFESILVEEGRVIRLRQHLERLFEGMRHIRIRSKETPEEMAALVREYINRNGLADNVLRVIVTRGVYDALPWDYRGPNSLYITHTSLPAVPAAPVRVVFLDETDYPIIRMHPAVKSLNYLGNMLAKMDAHVQGAFEPILYNKDRYITEGGIRNVFFVKDRTLYTPSLELGILPGTMRDAVIELAREQGIACRETRISLEEAHSMDEAFLTSTAVKILPVRWDGWQSDYALTEYLQQQLNIFLNQQHEELRG